MIHTTHTTTAANTAKVMYPPPQAKPIAMESMIARISLDEPGCERNLTRENTPSTAMPAPVARPLTIIISIATIAGMMVSVTAKLLEQ